MSTLRRSYSLAPDPAFRTTDQARIAGFVAQLDDQSRRLGKTVAELGVADLERQLRPGRNSVGMLLAHIAITEVFWTAVAAGKVQDRESAEQLSREVLGVGLDDDGMPAPPDAGHPAALAGWDLARYAGLLERARRYVKAESAAWRDADLAGTVVYRDSESTREWILYHLVEHYAQHAGQIGLVLALRGGVG